VEKRTKWSPGRSKKFRYYTTFYNRVVSGCDGKKTIQKAGSPSREKRPLDDLTRARYLDRPRQGRRCRHSARGFKRGQWGIVVKWGEGEGGGTDVFPKEEPTFTMVMHKNRKLEMSRSHREEERQDMESERRGGCFPFRNNIGHPGPGGKPEAETNQCRPLTLWREGEMASGKEKGERRSKQLGLGQRRGGINFNFYGRKTKKSPRRREEYP